MSNVLAALFGGLGAGAQSYGASRFREQEQERMAAQRMAELQQQEQARINAVKEQAAAQQATRLQQREAGANSIRALYPDFKAPDGDFDASLVLREMVNRETTNRANAANTTRRDIASDNNETRRDIATGRNETDRAIADARNAYQFTITKLLEAGRNQRDATPNTKAQPTVQDFYTKMLGQQDENGLPMSPEKAMAAAQRAYQVLTGAQAPARAQQQGNPGEGDLAMKAQQKIQSIMSDPTLSPEDKQDMVQQVNDILRSRLSAMRGGR